MEYTFVTETSGIAAATRREAILEGNVLDVR